MLIINSPIMQDKIIKIVSELEVPKCTFVKKDGIKIYFETTHENKEEAATLIKAAIKKDPIASAIMFNVKTDEYV